MRTGSHCRIGRPVKRKVIDPAEFFNVVHLRFIVISVIVSLDDIEKVFLISHGDRVVIFVC